MWAAGRFHCADNATRHLMQLLRQCRLKHAPVSTSAAAAAAAAADFDVN